MSPPPECWAVALSSLPAVGPARLRALLGSVEDPTDWEWVWADVRSGTVDLRCIVHPPASGAASIRTRWRDASRVIDPVARWEAHRTAGIAVLVHGTADYPAALVDDDDPPPIVFVRGDAGALAGPRVAIVGTRRATRYGIDIARTLGAELAEAGVVVVSGLALGIDGAAHSGVLGIDGAPPVAVVGSGLDHVYPRANRALWSQVAERGAVLSEYPLGVPAAAWQFPARNRIIAALSDVVVVVESQITGGALGTTVEAARRGRTVFAVPGPVTAPSSAGTNQLLHDGCPPARDATDVLVALGLSATTTRAVTARRPSPQGDVARVLQSLPWHAVPVEHIVVDTGLALGTVVLALDALDRDGWIVQRAGWVERVAR